MLLTVLGSFTNNNIMQQMLGKYLPLFLFFVCISNILSILFII